MWETSINKQSPDILDASAQNKRDEVIASYVKRLNELESQIALADKTLKDIKNDIDKVHADREAKYAEKESALNDKNAALQLFANELEKQGQELASKSAKLLEDIKAFDLKAQSTTSSHQTREDELNKFKQDLEDRKASIDHDLKNLEALNKMIDQKDDNVAILEAQLKEKEASLAEAKANLLSDIETHEASVNNHKNEVSAFNIERDRIMEFYHAIKAKEDALEPLKLQYEEGLDKNQKEALRLRDENIRITAFNLEAENRQNAAKEAQMKADVSIEKLEALKIEIDNKIKPSSTVKEN